MAQKWGIGARCAIVCSEHFENQNRVVEITEGPWLQDTGHTLWFVEDGKDFVGYNGNLSTEERRRAGPTERNRRLGIEQWKLRLLDEGEDVVIRDGIEYTVNA